MFFEFQNNKIEINLFLLENTLRVVNMNLSSQPKYHF